MTELRANFCVTSKSYEMNSNSTTSEVLINWNDGVLCWPTFPTFNIGIQYLIYIRLHLWIDDDGAKSNTVVLTQKHILLTLNVNTSDCNSHLYQNVLNIQYNTQQNYF